MTLPEMPGEGITSEEPFFQDKVTGEPCVRHQQVLCHSKDPGHQHVRITSEERRASGDLGADDMPFATFDSRDNAGEWVHLKDGSPCPSYWSDKPLAPGGRYWWCSIHQGYVRVANSERPRACRASDRQCAPFEVCRHPQLYSPQPSGGNPSDDEAQVIRDHRLQPRIREEDEAPRKDYECLCGKTTWGVAEWSYHVVAELALVRERKMKRKEP